MRNSHMKTIRAHFSPITRRLNGPIPVANNDQPRAHTIHPSSQIRELERKNRNLIERVKELQAENDQLNWWIGTLATENKRAKHFAKQQREAIETAGIQLRIAAASRKSGIYAK